MSHLLGLDTPDWNPRYRRNVIVYLWVYGILGAVTGITNNALLSYLDIAAPKVVRIKYFLGYFNIDDVLNYFAGSPDGL